MRGVRDLGGGRMRERMCTREGVGCEHCAAQPHRLRMLSHAPVVLCGMGMGRGLYAPARACQRTHPWRPHTAVAIGSVSCRTCSLPTRSLSCICMCTSSEPCEAACICMHLASIIAPTPHSHPHPRPPPPKSAPSGPPLTDYLGVDTHVVLQECRRDAGAPDGAALEAAPQPHRVVRVHVRQEVVLAPGRLERKAVHYEGSARYPLDRLHLAGHPASACPICYLFAPPTTPTVLTRSTLPPAQP